MEGWTELDGPKDASKGYSDKKGSGLYNARVWS